MALTPQNFEVIRGDSDTLSINLTNPKTGAAFNPTGHFLILSVKLRTSDGTGDSEAAIQKTSTTGLTVTDAATGVIAAEFVSVDTSALIVRTPYVFDVQAQNVSNGLVTTVAVGTIKNRADVTEGTTATVPIYTANPTPNRYPWSLVTDTPTTLAGYGITDAGGDGTGDVVGPAGATADRIATFDSTTGKRVKDGGKTIAGVLTDAAAATATAIARTIMSAVHVAEGDSLTAGGWPAIAAGFSYFTGRSTVTNVATSGHTLASIVSEYTAQVYPLRPASANGACLFVWIGANDLATCDPVAWLVSWRAYVTQAKADGFRVVAFTIMRRADVGLDREWARAIMNQGIIKARGDIVDTVIDTGNTFDPTDATSFAYHDSIHLSTAGYTVLAAMVNSQLESRGATLARDVANAPLYANGLFLVDTTANGRIFSYDPKTGTQSMYKWSGTGATFHGFRSYYDSSAMMHFQTSPAAAWGSHSWTDRFTVSFDGNMALNGPLDLSTAVLALTSAQIGWTYLNKTGSSLGDLATRSATDLTSGTLNNSRLPSLVAVSGLSASGTGAPSSGSSVEIQFATGDGIIRAYNRSTPGGLPLWFDDQGGLLFAGTARTQLTNAAGKLLTAALAAVNGTGSVVLTDSAALTGTPTAPTASAATANTQLATTAFVGTAIANLIASAPGALDTLDELAAAFGDDPNFAATMTTALATKLVKSANLSDLTNAGTARTNLGLGTLATQSGTFSGTSSGTNTGDQSSVSGNAGTATALATSRTINGVGFDGTANISLTTQGTLTGTTPAITFAATPQARDWALTGNSTPTASGYAAGYCVDIFITGDSVLRTFTWPSWTWIGGSPADLAANKHMRVSLECRGSTAASVYATYAVEA